MASVTVIYSVGKAGLNVTAAVDPVTRAFTVELPDGFYSGAALQADGSGLPPGKMWITAGPAGSSDTGQSAGITRFSIKTQFTLAPTTTAPDAGPVSDYIRVLDGVDATSFSYTTSYRSTVGANDIQAKTGQVLRMTNVPAMSGTVVSWIVPQGTQNPGVPARADLGADTSTVSVTLPVEANLRPLLDGNGRSTLRIETTEGRNQITIEAPITVVHTPTSGPGITTRISGANRYTGAVAYSQASWPDLVDGNVQISNLYLASGESFADALSTAAVAAQTGGDLLLLPSDYPVDPQIGAEVARLLPQRGWLIGGQNVVPEGVRSSFAIDANLYPARIAGADRYETSRQLVGFAFGGGTKTVFLATGESFPDALSAVSAATSQHAPVLLVRGSQPTLDAATLATLTNIGATSYVLVGGNLSISTGIEQQLNAQHPGSVTRIGGVDRYAVSAAINQRYFPTATQAFLATGASYPDALTGGVLAARAGAPLLLVQPNCVPAPAGAALSSWNVATTTLLGGPASLSQDVLDLTPCS